MVPRGQLSDRAAEVGTVKVKTPAYLSTREAASGSAPSFYSFT